MPSRRTILGGTAALLAGAYVNQRGLRYPRMGFEPRMRTSTMSDRGVRVDLNHAIFTLAANHISARAISPEPVVRLSSESTTKIKLEIGNVATNAQLKVTGGAGNSVEESANGLLRTLSISCANQLELRWQLPEQGRARFAVIGDTGAGEELSWVLDRAASLGADFLLHLGDFNYVDGEYEQAIMKFNNAPLPCFISIGNHDFNDSGLVYDAFLSHLGPLNHRFSFAGTQFVNIDTAADFLPAYSGHRGTLLRELERDAVRSSDYVCFTHRNFLDPRPGRDHTIGGVGERPWLADKLVDCGVNNILTGHVHRSAEMEYRGLNQFTVGEGLGFEDIVHEQLVAQLLIGDVEQGSKVRYQWTSLQLPWAMHTSPEHEEKLIREHPAHKLKWYQDKLAATKISARQL